MNQPPKYPSVVERNFKAYFVEENTGIKYLRHPTGVVIMTLGTDHELMGRDIAEIQWNIPNKRGKGVDRSKLEVSGKGKKGGLHLCPETRICIVKDSTGKEYTIRSGIRGTLIEVNDDRLSSDPNLIRKAPDNYGFIAIVMPTLNGRTADLPKGFQAKA